MVFIDYRPMQICGVYRVYNIDYRPTVCKSMVLPDFYFIYALSLFVGCIESGGLAFNEGVCKPLVFTAAVLLIHSLGGVRRSRGAITSSG